MTIYNWLLIACWAVFIVYWAVSALNTKRTTKSNFLQGILWRLAGGVLIAVVLTAFYHGSFPKGGLIPEFATGSVPPALGFASVALAAFGIGFAVWARTYLGRNWGMPRSIKENPELVTTGPYAYVRHPIYTGVLLALLGSVLMSGLPWLIVFVVACGYFIYSAYQEEGVMLRTFPESYPPYKARTKMLIPFIF